jgi:hypothetical protein
VYYAGTVFLEAASVPVIARRGYAYDIPWDIRQTMHDDGTN